MSSSKTYNSSYEYLNEYIIKVLKTINPDVEISNDAVKEVNLITHNLARKICDLTNKSDINIPSFEGIIKSILPTRLAKRSISEGNRAIDKDSKTILIFPFTFVEKLIKNVDTETAKYLTAILEYVTAEILELSVYSAGDFCSDVVEFEHVKTAIENNEELNQLLNN